METVTTTTVPVIWGPETLAKKTAHYSRLRAPQAKARAKKHLKRINQLLGMKTRMSELGIPWVANAMFDYRLKFEYSLLYAAQAAHRKCRSQTPEAQLESQRGFKLSS